VWVLGISIVETGAVAAVTVMLSTVFALFMRDSARSDRRVDEAQEARIQSVKEELERFIAHYERTVRWQHQRITHLEMLIFGETRTPYPPSLPLNNGNDD
jgi:hypothetical protein